MIAREELEHELDSKNHTIRMLQKQLVSKLKEKLKGTDPQLLIMPVVLSFE